MNPLVRKQPGTLNQAMRGPVLGDAKQPSQVTVVETVYHRSGNDQPTCVDSRYARLLASDEQPYHRDLVLSEAWVPLDVGWLKSCCLLVVKNTEGTNPSTIPTPQRVADVKRRVVELSFLPGDGLAWLVLPGESFRGQPSCVGKLWMRCRSGTAKVSISVFPE